MENSAPHKMRKAGVVRTTDADQFKTAQEKTDDENLKIAEARNRANQTRFVREFSRSLDVGQITAASRLLWAFHVFETAGNATAAYDAVSIKGVTYGPKDGAPNRVIDAGKIIACAKETLLPLSIEYPLFHILTMALVSDWPPVKVGELCQRFARKQWKERWRRQVGVQVIDQATAPLVMAFKERGFK